MEITACTWDEVRNQVTQVNPSLAKAIDEFEPDDDYILYKARYAWGDHVLHEGRLMIPVEENRYLKIDDSSVDPKIRKDLIYNQTTPLGLVLKNSLELYYNNDGDILPFSIMPAGKLFGLWVSFQSNETSSHTGKTSNIVAGARSLVMGPKIGNDRSFKKLSQKHKGIGQPPQCLAEHWQLFKNLYDSEEPEWHTEVLFFSEKWLEARDDIQSRLLKQYFLDICWESTAYLRDQPVYDLLFSHAIRQRNLRPNPYLLDTVKHLHHIARGACPGFCVAHSNDMLPLDFFESIFLDDYNLKYAPTIFHLGHIDTEPNLYYSLEHPTITNFSPKSKKFSSKIEDLREIKHIVKAMIKFLEIDQWELDNSPIHHLLDTDFQYLHPDEDIYQESAHTKNLLHWDPHITRSVERSDGRPFAESCQLLRGSVLVSTEKKLTK